MRGLLICAEASAPLPGHGRTRDTHTVDAAPLVQECLRRKLLINCTHGTVIRLLPALTLADDQLAEGCAILEDVLQGASAVSG